MSNIKPINVKLLSEIVHASLSFLEDEDVDTATLIQ